MKRLSLMVLALVLSCVVFAGTWTDPSTGISWTYTGSNGKISLGGGDSSRTAVPTDTKGSLTIPSWLLGLPVTSIGNAAFQCCSGLTSVVIHEGVTDIGSGAFWCCGALTNFIVAAKNPTYWSVNGLLLTKDGTTLLIGVNGDVTIPSSVTTIDSAAFECCTRLTRVTIPSSVTSIGDRAFYGCSGLTSVTIPPSVTSIGSAAFYGCSGLTRVIIPPSVTDIGFGAFQSCSGMTNFVVASENPNYCSVNGLLLTKNGTKLITGVNGDVTIPPCVTRIGVQAFEGCSGLTSVTIPSSVTTIDSAAFERCTGLTRVTLPPSVTRIFTWAFSHCNGLSSITFSGNAPSIDNGAFAGVPATCRVYVQTGTTGWGVDIPGTWHGFPIDYLPEPSLADETHYGIVFAANGGTGEMTGMACERDVVYMLPDCALTPPDGKSFAGWMGANGRRYDPGVLVFNLVPAGETITLTAIWS